MNKEQLDTLMSEYYYEKNNVEDTLEFLAFMFNQYEKIMKEAHENQSRIRRVKVRL